MKASTVAHDLTLSPSAARVLEELLRSVNADYDEADVDNLLASVEQAADGAMPGFEAFFYNRSGDLCVHAGLDRRALGYFGRAIDAYLKDGRWEMAAGVCEKILGIDPHAVRPRCTLAWIAIAADDVPAAMKRVKAYAQVAALKEAHELAALHMTQMARLALDPDLLWALAQGLLEVGAEDQSSKVFSRAMALSLGTVVMAPPEERWKIALDAALMGPADITNLPHPATTHTARAVM